MARYCIGLPYNNVKSICIPYTSYTPTWKENDYLISYYRLLQYSRETKLLFAFYFLTTRPNKEKITNGKIIYKMYLLIIISPLLWSVKASFLGLFRTNFTGHFCKLFSFTKFDFNNLQNKFPYDYT